MESLFCPECHNLLDLPGDEDYVTCTVCSARQSSSVFENRPVVTKSRTGLFGDVFRKKVVTSAAKVHDEGATVFYEHKLDCVDQGEMSKVWKSRDDLPYDAATIG